MDRGVMGSQRVTKVTKSQTRLSAQHIQCEQKISITQACIIILLDSAVSTM